MKLTPEEKRRINSGDPVMLKQVLSRELEVIKKELLAFRPTTPEYDLVLKGKGTVIEELLNLLG